MRFTRRHTLGTLAGAAFAPRAFAQAYPARPITIVVPYPAGGSVDVVARILGEAMGPDLGTNFVVENKGGAAGSVGSAAVARAAPDGYTLVLGTQQTHATNPSLLKALPYDPVKDFSPVAGLAVIPHLLVTRKDLGVSSVKELIALANAKPDGLTYGSTGLGSASHLAMELFRKQAGIGKLVHVPFRGGSPMMQELLGGRVDLSIASIPTVIAQVDAGDLKALAVAREERIARLPDLPTTTEAGVPGVDADAWFALFAPASTSQDIIDRLYAAIGKAAAREEVRQKIAAQGMVLALRPGAEIAKELPGEVAKWAAVVQAAGVKAE